jgi:hypothetical protein
MTALHDWLHALPAAHVQLLRDFRRAARAAYPGPDSLAKALDAGNLEELLHGSARPPPAPSPAEAAAIISAMPRDFVIGVDHSP